MNKLICKCAETPQNSKVTPKDEYINIYTNGGPKCTGGIIFDLLSAAESARSLSRAGFILQISRDAAGDITIRKVREFA